MNKNKKMLSLRLSIVADQTDEKYKAAKLKNNWISFSSISAQFQRLPSVSSITTLYLIYHHAISDLSPPSIWSITMLYQSPLSVPLICSLYINVSHQFPLPVPSISTLCQSPLLVPSISALYQFPLSTSTISISAFYQYPLSSLSISALYQSLYQHPLSMSAPFISFVYQCPLTAPCVSI